MRECNEYEITVAKLLKIIHRHTERIKIYVVGGVDMMEDNVREFYITEDFSKNQEETDRVLKYYGDVPVWNIHVETNNIRIYDSHGSYTVTSIVANCHYSDAKAGYLQEKEDRRKAKRREYYQKRKAEKSDE